MQGTQLNEIYRKQYLESVGKDEKFLISFKYYFLSSKALTLSSIIMNL